MELFITQFKRFRKGEPLLSDPFFDQKTRDNTQVVTPRKPFELIFIQNVGRWGPETNRGPRVPLFRSLHPPLT